MRYPLNARKRQFHVSVSAFALIASAGICRSATIGGTVSGHNPDSGSAIYMFYNGTELPPIGSNGVFPPFTANAGPYSITLPTSPSGETCSVINGTGTVSDANPITNVWIICQPIGFTPPAPRWTPLANPIPGRVNNAMLLLSDGSVLVNTGYRKWYRLIPRRDGSYVNGTWMAVQDSNCEHGQFASQVLPDGSVFVAGGELPGTAQGLAGCAQPGIQAGTGVDTEILSYNQAAKQYQWTEFLRVPVTVGVHKSIATVNPADPPTSLIDPTQPGTGGNNLCGGLQAFSDMISETLPDGSVLMSPVCPMNCGDTLIFNYRQFNPNIPGSGWSPGGKLHNTMGPPLSCSEQEATWVKLQDGSILTTDPPPSPEANQTAERYIPSSHQWVNDTALGFSLFDNVYGYNTDGEEGPAFVLPNGNAIYIGGSPYTGTYTPASTSGPSFWTQTLLEPNGLMTTGAALAADDMPGAMMANGKILLALNYAPILYPWFWQQWQPGPWFFYEYDPGQGTYTEVPGPEDPGSPGANGSGVWTDCGGIVITMLNLPDGTVLMPSGCPGAQLYVFHPDGAPLPAGQPIITNITKNSDGSYHLVGTTLNGISEGSSFGDDAQNASNYPLIRLSSTNGNTFYARTFNWSSTTVNPGAVGSTDFELPAGACNPSYALQVVANGNASAAQSFEQTTCELNFVIPICHIPCGIPVVIWVPGPILGLGDPWLDESSLTLLTISQEDAASLAETEQVLLSTRSFLSTESERLVEVEVAGQKLPRRSRALVVGPTLEVRERPSKSVGLSTPTIAKDRKLVGVISLPYQSGGLSSRTSIRIVAYDSRRARWVDVGPQKLDETKHLVTARISNTGSFTVVAYAN